MNFFALALCCSKDTKSHLIIPTVWYGILYPVWYLNNAGCTSDFWMPCRRSLLAPRDLAESPCDCATSMKIKSVSVGTRCRVCNCTYLYITLFSSL